MLRSLVVDNFALINHAAIAFPAGLTVLTGETGAGKSILLNALNIVLGGRASLDTVRKGSEFLRVEAVFAINPASPAGEILNQQDIMLEDGDTLIINRRLNRNNGKNLILVNGRHLTLSVLRQIGEKLVDMHGQHENQSLLHQESYLDLLDMFAKDNLAGLEQYRQYFREWTELTRKIAQREADTANVYQRIDMLTWQTREIAAANLIPGEEEKVVANINRLANAEKIVRAVTNAYNLLEQDDGGGRGILALLAGLRQELEVAARYDDGLQPALAVVTDAGYQLEEVKAGLRNYNDSLEYDPEQLDKLQIRLDTIQKLRKKYGPTIEEILAYWAKAQTELAAVTNHETDLQALNQQKNDLETELHKLADNLSFTRIKLAQKLSAVITGHLNQLGMKGSRLAIKVESGGGLNLSGQDKVELLFSANPGEELKVLSKVASGGELSRIALAIKTVYARHDKVGTLVFDEIDAGIGGRTAQAVAERIARIAGFKQVLCITHLPQIAGMADHHICVDKVVADGRTITTITPLGEPERVAEIARMMYGTETSELTTANVKQILKNNSKKKEAWKKEALD